ncbi:mobilome CxxCx(11)CxxC protein [Vibrio splendidus]|nr:mobilome CxxCx(11)CxxC protein [Vibrio splendidus]
MDIKEKAKDYEFWCFGTTRVFEARASSLKRSRTLITFLGLVTPVVVGGVVLSFGYDSKALPAMLVIAGLVGICQLVLSTWSIVARWDEVYEYAVESLRDNTELYNKFKQIKESNLSSERLNDDFQSLRIQYENREFRDLGQAISDKEKRFANHQALLYFSQECHVCKKIPTSNKPTKCNSCGNY